MDNEIEIQDESPNTDATADLTQRRVNTLHKAALKGDWKAAKGTVSLDRNITWSVKITKEGNTALHIAVSAKQTAFVRNLVECLEESELELKNEYGYTAFCTAAVSGVVEIAKVMYHKNENLPAIRSKGGYTPLKIAIWFRNTEMAEYLYPVTPLGDLEEEEYIDILVEAICSDMYDIALKMLKERSKIATSTEILQSLAQKHLSYNHKFQGWIWERLVSVIANIPWVPCKSINLSHSSPQTQILHDAAKIGNVEFLTLITQSFPELTWNVDSNNYSIFHVVVINRQEKVFSLIYQTGAAKDFNIYYRDNDKNNILHLAGKLAPSNRLNIVSGPALQMYGQTPRELFTLEHEKLREDGEKWMKKTATSCMVVATLIATVVFAAAFTVPGGYKEENGAPIFLNNGWFKIFVTFDVVAMFTSIASIMTFLSLFTAQYREDDFLFSLPAKLMIGLFTLFASIVYMVITFSATFFLVYKEEKHGTMPKLVAALGSLPIILYTLLNCKLWIALIHSTFFASRFMFRPSKNRLFE
ncbi:ankyrin repeat-containing ITN1-like isoform X1 [Olea europaea subsp. europaea]|uniref:Ankyrin repeat-containing ITN1-like isoform X1 n=1 Tax=Olea europaea subsp. europaea TaxID=158383 RepID=A0A8S0PPZ7_OLEEU|nr:ankyrin repeat-containing ITN1-like isoform X1 [Olea europaea subsp. europaea]